MTTTAIVITPHAEVANSVRTGETIRIWCDCPIGENHTYADWVERFGETLDRGPTG